MTTQRRPVRHAKVVATERVTSDIVRVEFLCPDLADVKLDYTDHYVKLLFAPPGATYSWPFDPQTIRETCPREQWPVTRTYTIRWRHEERLAIDFLVHGEVGLAGLWAASAQPGDEIGFLGPGGAWAPVQGIPGILVGDESALPAIAAALDVWPHDTPIRLYLEVADESARYPLPEVAGSNTDWVYRRSCPPGQQLSAAVRRDAPRDDAAQWFIHGSAEMVRDLRRFLFVDHDIPRDNVSISGYWRSGCSEDEWQAGKRELTQQWDTEEQLARQSRLVAVSQHS